MTTFGEPARLSAYRRIGCPGRQEGLSWLGAAGVADQMLVVVFVAVIVFFQFQLKNQTGLGIDNNFHLLAIH